MTGVAIGGFMATGKSTVGPLVAARLGVPFVDLDRAVEGAAGASVGELFAREGEAAFRARETRALREILAGPDVVLALGGGTLHHGDNLERLRARYRVVVLDLPWEDLAPRLDRGAGRPLAGGGRALWEQRRPGDLRAGTPVDVRGLAPDEVATAVLECL
ncbi:shikimate kinase [Myxococcota bacterium]|nr:shikimate kinase [Myxococcota bacterium]